MATILWLQPLWAHRDKIPQYCNSTWKPMSESSSAIKRYGNRYSDKLYPNTCCLFLDAYCVGKHQILRKSSNFHKIPLVNHWIFRKISYLCPQIKAFFAYCKIQKRAEVRSFPYCYLYNIGKRPTSWFSIKVQFRASYIVLPIIPCVTAIDKHFYPLLIWIRSFGNIFSCICSSHSVNDNRCLPRHTRMNSTALIRT